VTDSTWVDSSLIRAHPPMLYDDSWMRYTALDAFLWRAMIVVALVAFGLWVSGSPWRRWGKGGW
jgi:hypothetical protein